MDSLQLELKLCLCILFHKFLHCRHQPFSFNYMTVMFFLKTFKFLCQSLSSKFTSRLVTTTFEPFINGKSQTQPSFNELQKCFFSCFCSLSHSFHHQKLKPKERTFPSAHPGPVREPESNQLRLPPQVNVNSECTILKLCSSLTIVSKGK